MPTLLETAAHPFLPGVSHDRLRAYAVLLRRYRCANILLPDREQSGWTQALGELPSAALQRLSRLGLIGAASAESSIACQSKAQIQKMLADRGLPAARTKVDGAKRLIEADPSGMEAFVKTAALAEMTPLAQPIIDAFDEEERLAKVHAEALALAALNEGRFEDARVIGRDYSTRRVIRVDDLFSVEADPVELAQIMQLRPAILRDMPEESWDLIRAPTAMSMLFGDPVRTWLPSGSLHHPRLKDDDCCRMLMFAATHQRIVENYRNMRVVTGVTILTATDLTQVCSVCQADAGKTYSDPSRSRPSASGLHLPDWLPLLYVTANGLRLSG